MPMSFPGKSRLIPALLLVAALLGRSQPATAQDMPSEQSVRAAMVFNFLKFTEFPPEALANTQRIRLCIAVGDPRQAEALTALALLFSFFRVNPSPFCVMDEADAPLDEANVERFVRLIREFSTTTQFIVITHNKRTMEAADTLYGVTMEELGVSKLISVDLKRAAGMVAQQHPVGV